MDDTTDTMVDEGELQLETDEPERGEEPANAKLTLANQLLDEAVTLLKRVQRLLGDQPHVNGYVGTSDTSEDEEGDGRVIEGVFDGQKMIGPDGRHYSVPANYASKSKLVEGDLLKLTITGRGAFIYKQIGPIPRRRVLGSLQRSLSGSEWCVKASGRNYAVLTASVTFFHGHEGDEVAILVPESGESKWAAVENIIKNSGLAHRE